MIAVTDGRKRFPSTVLAYTPYREIAYYIEPDSSLDSCFSREAWSPSGAEWYPEILENGRLTAFIAGNPGAGKSYLAKQLIQLLPEDYDILLFTALEEDDGNFKEFKDRLWKIRMEPEVLKTITLSAIRARSKHPILLFDDIDKIRDKTVEKLTFAILEDALANGRGHKKHNGEGDIHTIVTSHALNDYRKTKYTLENSDYVGVFPASTTKCQYDRMFQKLGLPQELCDFTYEMGKNGECRSVLIKKTAPMYLIASPFITLI